MPKELIELMLHPVRMQILQTLAPAHTLTATQIAERLPSIPQATLYRHLSKLVEAELLAVVEQNQVRGTIEKVYALKTTTLVDAGDITLDDHLRFFLAFTANLTRSFEEYLSKDSADPNKDWVSYRTVRVYASAEEFAAFRQALHQAFASLTKNEPSPERKGLDIATILIPRT